MMQMFRGGITHAWATNTHSQRRMIDGSAAMPPAKVAGIGISSDSWHRVDTARISMSDVTRIFQAIEHDDAKAADELLTVVYDELRRVAAKAFFPRR
jgi:hypothetical protein